MSCAGCPDGTAGDGKCCIEDSDGDGFPDRLTDGTCFLLQKVQRPSRGKYLLRTIVHLCQTLVKRMQTVTDLETLVTMTPMAMEGGTIRTTVQPFLIEVKRILMEMG